MPRLTTLDAWTAPWEGKDEEIDPDKVKSFVFAEKKRAQDLEDENKTLKTEVKDRDTKIAAFEKAEEDRSRENESAEEKAQRERDARAKADADHEKEVADAKRENALLKVRLETGLTEKQANRLSGDDFDALLEDAKEYIEENGLDKAGEEDDPDDAGETSLLRRQPETKRINRGDPAPKRSKEQGGDDIAKAVLDRHADLFA